MVALAVAGALLGGVWLARRRLLLVEVVGDSMSPVFDHGDRLLVRRARRFRVGDVVIAHHQIGGRRTVKKGSPETNWLVKKLAAMPGDPVPASVAAAVGSDRRTVPPGAVVLLGASPDSADSRMWGFVPVEDLAGVVITGLGTGRGADQGPDTPGR
ncbi:S26 family signal peptidase [Cryptosporangium minutisporangium]|uniref:S26 family signal peptidase n=1 Tax=Cryptosporangium minutisporangium TaxID=113569 RepID=A0ABP6T0H2_9ACTN